MTTIVDGTTGVSVPGTGSVVLNGSSSGSTTLSAAATASGTLTLPATTDTVVARATTDALSNKTITLSAGTASVAPLTLTSGTNLTTAAAGAEEYDGTVFYKTNNASNRGLLPSVQYAILNNTTYTLTSQTAAQKLFNSSTNGTITLPIGFFEFECYYALTSMSSTSGSFGFALAGTATYTQAWMATALKNAAGSAGATAGTSYNTAANTTLVTANTTTTAWAYIKGTIRVSVAGTVIPQVSLGVASAAIVSTGSYFKITQIANTTNQTIGNWS